VLVEEQLDGLADKALDAGVQRARVGSEDFDCLVEEREPPTGFCLEGCSNRLGGVRVTVAVCADQGLEAIALESRIQRNPDAVLLCPLSGHLTRQPITWGLKPGKQKPEVSLAEVVRWERVGAAERRRGVYGGDLAGALGLTEQPAARPTKRIQVRDPGWLATAGEGPTQVEVVQQLEV
jgi:hypothetical protein